MEFLTSFIDWNNTEINVWKANEKTPGKTIFLDYYAEHMSNIWHLCWLLYPINVSDVCVDCNVSCMFFISVCVVLTYIVK